MYKSHKKTLALIIAVVIFCVAKCQSSHVGPSNLDTGMSTVAPKSPVETRTAAEAELRKLPTTKSSLIDSEHKPFEINNNDKWLAAETDASIPKIEREPESIPLQTTPLNISYSSSIGAGRGLRESSIEAKHDIAISYKDMSGLIGLGVRGLTSNNTSASASDLRLRLALNWEKLQSWSAYAGIDYCTEAYVDTEKDYMATNEYVLPTIEAKRKIDRYVVHIEGGAAYGHYSSNIPITRAAISFSRLIGDINGLDLSLGMKISGRQLVYDSERRQRHILGILFIESNW